VDAHAIQFLATSAVELEALEAWCDVPDMDEGDVSKLHAPFTGDADTTTEGHELVAETLAQVEAGVSVLPDTVHGVSALGLSEDILEGDLKVVIDVVGVTFDEIGLIVRHGCCFL